MTTWTESLGKHGSVLGRSPAMRVWSLPMMGVEVVSTDVFDTILLRRPVSERRRIMRAETHFSRELAAAGFPVEADHLVEARLQAQAMAFKALEIGGMPGEVGLIGVIRRQLRLLGLDPAFAEQRLRWEIAIEKECLEPAPAAAKALVEARTQGRRVIAVSDTMLPARAVQDLIEHFYGPGLVDMVYASADANASKRDGALFDYVLKAEGIRPDQLLHIGDDPVADQQRPQRVGICTVPVPRPRVRRLASRAEGARAEYERRSRRSMRSAGQGDLCPTDPESFGRDVLGPIAVDLSRRIWLYAAEAASAERPVMLFCARGGIGIREIFERVLVRLRLPLDVPRHNFLVSRLVAARLALARRSPSVAAELGREFAGRSLADAVRALGTGAAVPADGLKGPFSYDGLTAYLDSPSSAGIRSEIEQQNRLFCRHFDGVRVGCDRVILCDTGLFGSTQRLLSTALPDVRLETIQFARSNYKGHSEDHFGRVAGLCVEQRHYDPLSIESAVLRYWHVIERLFEIDVASVRTFGEGPDGRPIANCGALAGEGFDAVGRNALLRGAIAYVDALPRDGEGIAAAYDAERAWPALHRAIVRPGPADVACIGGGDRSVDFGRDDSVWVIVPSRDPSFAARVAAIPRSLWREGAIVQAFPRAHPLILAGLEKAHAFRGLSSKLRGRR